MYLSDDAEQAAVPADAAIAFCEASHVGEVPTLAKTLAA